MIRPAAMAALLRWHEVAIAGAIGAFGLWLMVLGGYILLPIGATFLVLGAVMGVMAHRRMRFSAGVGAAGMIEVDEAQIGYFGPEDGGFISLPDLTELRLLRINNARFWRLKQADGQTLLIPADAAGSERLFDAFSSLPNMDTAALVASLDPAARIDLAPIWQRAHT